MNNNGLSIHWKLLTGFVGIVVLTVTILLFSVSQIFENRIRNEINSSFVEAGHVFERIQDIRFRQLRQTAILLAEAPSLKAAVSTGDTSTVNQKLRDELRYLLDFDPIMPDSLLPQDFFTDPDSSGLLLVCDSNGIPLGQMATSGLPRYSIADRAGIARALQGDVASQTYIWEQNERYFNVLTVPIWRGNDLLGTLSYGFPIRHMEAEQLSRDVNMEVSYFVENALIASSFDNLIPEYQNHLSKQIHSATFDILNSSEATTFEFVMDSEQWLVYVTPMHRNVASVPGTTGYYTVAQSLTKALNPLKNLQFIIFGIGIAAIIAAISVSFWITRRITKPISLLVAGVERIEQEEFGQEVPVISNDELGQLTRSFNNLVQSLRERLLMLKFVSKATLDAIKGNLSRIEPGGERREVTVLFSDIRGFTSWSENHTSEEVIDMLNNLLSFQAEMVQSFDGDVDKFVGDELIAVFQGEDKDQRAVNAAVKIQKKVARLLNEEQTSDLAVGIGINSGEVVMGAMGSENRMDYTVLGSSVNLGARLCSAAKQHQVLISHSVYLSLERRIPVERLDSIKVKGIEQPVDIYEINWQENEALIFNL